MHPTKNVPRELLHKNVPMQNFYTSNQKAAIQLSNRQIPVSGARHATVRYSARGMRETRSAMVQGAFLYNMLANIERCRVEAYVSSCTFILVT